MTYCSQHYDGIFVDPVQYACYEAREKTLIRPYVSCARVNGLMHAQVEGGMLEVVRTIDTIIMV